MTDKIIDFPKYRTVQLQSTDDIHSRVAWYIENDTGQLHFLPLFFELSAEMKIEILKNLILELEKQ